MWHGRQFEYSCGRATASDGRSTSRRSGLGFIVLAAWLAQASEAGAQSWLDQGAVTLRRSETPFDVVKTRLSKSDATKSDAAKSDFVKSELATPLDLSALRHIRPEDLSALAQSRRDDDRASRDADRRDSSHDRSPSSSSDASQSSEKKSSDSDKKSSTPKDMEFMLTLPLMFTTNPLIATTDQPVGRGRPDLYTAPDITLKYSHQFDEFKLTATGGIGTDRYLRTTDADEGTVFWSLKASLTDGRSDVFIPYVSYAGVAGFEPDFSRNTDITNDLSVGFISGIGFKKDGKEIQSSDATDPGESSLDFDLRLTRRAAEPSRLDFVQIQATLAYQYVFSKEWSIMVEPRIRVRWYDDPVDGVERRDIRPRVMVKAVWTPEWLTKKIKRAEIDFLLYGQRNFSTVKAEEFTQWEVGPSVLLAWKF